MVLSIEVSNGYYMIKLIHTIISGAFLLIAVWLIIRSGRGILKNHAYTAIDRFLSYGFIINLYLQLVFGLILFSIRNSTVNDNFSSAEEAIKMASNRFWPIEHIVLMLFALFIANLGLILSNQSLSDREKHKKILTYYVVALLMIAISLIAI